MDDLYKLFCDTPHNLGEVMYSAISLIHDLFILLQIFIIVSCCPSSPAVASCFSCETQVFLLYTFIQDDQSK